MLILCSDGLSSDLMLEAVRKRTAGCKTAALVVTADSVYKEKNRHVPRCMRELETLGLTVTLFDLDRQPAEELLSYDVVEFIGGNPFYLLDSVRKHDAAPVLRTLARDRVLIGWSAAVFVFGPSLELMNRYTPEMNTPGLTDLRGIALTDMEFLPHYSKFLKKFDRFEEKCQEYEQEKHIKVTRISDGEGVIFDGDQTEFCLL